MSDDNFFFFFRMFAPVENIEFQELGLYKASTTGPVQPIVDLCVPRCPSNSSLAIMLSVFWPATVCESRPYASCRVTASQLSDTRTVDDFSLVASCPLWTKANCSDGDAHRWHEDDR